MHSDAGIAGLADAIDALRLELLDALNRASGQKLRFRLGEIEMNVEAVVTTGMDGRIGWSVLGAGAKRESEMSHRLTFVLKPLWGPGDDDAAIDEFVIADHNSSGMVLGTGSKSQSPKLGSHTTDTVYP